MEIEIEMRDTHLCFLISCSLFPVPYLLVHVVTSTARGEMKRRDEMRRDEER